MDYRNEDDAARARRDAVRRALRDLDRALRDVSPQEAERERFLHRLDLLDAAPQEGRPTRPPPPRDEAYHLARRRWTARTIAVGLMALVGGVAIGQLLGAPPAGEPPAVALPPPRVTVVPVPPSGPPPTVPDPLVWPPPDGP